MRPQVGGGPCAGELLTHPLTSSAQCPGVEPSLPQPPTSSPPTWGSAQLPHARSQTPASPAARRTRSAASRMEGQGWLEQGALGLVPVSAACPASLAAAWARLPPTGAGRNPWTQTSAAARCPPQSLGVCLRPVALSPDAAPSRSVPACPTVPHPLLTQVTRLPETQNPEGQRLSSRSIERVGLE